MAGKASIYYPKDVKPSIGNTINGSKLGRVTRALFRWSACPDCGVERWVQQSQKTKLCMRCAAIRRNWTGEKNHRWNGGIRRAGGYNYVSVPENHLFIKMAGRSLVHGRYYYSIAEHRLVVTQHIGRPLEPWELVHHINGVKDDNRIGNLELLKHRKDHLVSANFQRLVVELQERVVTLEAEVVLLRSLLNERRDSVPAENLSL